MSTTVEVIARRPFQLDGQHVPRGGRVVVTERQAAQLRARRYARVCVPEQRAVIEDPVLAPVTPAAPPPPPESSNPGHEIVEAGPRRRRRSTRRPSVADPA